MDRSSRQKNQEGNTGLELYFRINGPNRNIYVCVYTYVHIYIYIYVCVYTEHSI